MKQKTENTTCNVLLIDDNEMMQGVMTVLLREAGFGVTPCQSGSVALTLSQQQPFKIYVIDYLLADMKGDTVAAELRRLHPSAVIIGCSVEPNEQAFLTAGADVFILKENIHRELMPFVRRFLSAS